jgi:hypothetical protein
MLFAVPFYKLASISRRLSFTVGRQPSNIRTE